MKHRLVRVVCALSLMFITGWGLRAVPSIYPTGTTVFDPDRTWSGYTIFATPDSQGTVVVDMNGTLVKRWTQIASVPSPVRILPGGFVMGGSAQRKPHQESIALVQLDWEGNEVWRFDRTEEVTLEDGETTWAARHHHDWQRQGNAVGYYSPAALPLVDAGRTLVLAHRNVTVPDISDKRLEDDLLLEVTWDGEIVWEWLASDHVDELGFTEEARNTIHRSVDWNEDRESADWLHINAAAYVGENKWFDGGDTRFHPENILWSSREANIMAIVDRAGSVVWRMGPDFRESAALRDLGQIVGQHQPHIIPKGLPGAGNLLVFDNGGAAGYGAPNPTAPTGRGTAVRIHSRVLEIDPVSFEKVWEYSISGRERFQFASHYVSSAQRLPNGNTLITEGAGGRIFEIAEQDEIVWEYVSPYFGTENSRTNRIFRAHRVPYDWVPQLEPPVERRVVPPDIREFRIEPQ